MKKVLLTLFIITIFSACSNKQNQEIAQPPIPKALQEKGSYEIVTKRTIKNVVENLYEELVKNSTELKNVESAIETVTNNRNDSTKNFNFYNDKNLGYYEQANQLTVSMQDSLLKEKIKKLIVNSSNEYKNKIEGHTKLIESINSKMLSLADLHSFLKYKPAWQLWKNTKQIICPIKNRWEIMQSK